MKPDLGAVERPEGPQVISQAPDADPSGPFDDRLAYAAYDRQIPDYVLGTDWKKLVEAPPPAYAPGPEPDEPLPAPEEAEVGTYTPAVYQAAAAPHVSYPSLDGGAAYEDVSRAEKTPVIPLVELDADAPPEATGDTTRAH